MNTKRSPWILVRGLAVVICLGAAAQAWATSARMYVMNDLSVGSEAMYVINIADVQQLGTSAITVGPAIALNSQLSADYRSVTVLADGRLVMETVSTNRLSYWSADGVYDSATGQFGGSASWGVTALYDGRFLSHSDTTDQVSVYVAGQKAPAYTLTLRTPTGGTLPNLNFHTGQLAARQGGGFYAIAAGRTDYVFDTIGDAAHTTINAIKTGSQSTGDSSRITPLPGGWGGTHADNRWYRYNDATLTGTAVYGPAGYTVVDVAPLGEGYTGGLYRSNTTGTSHLVLWDNTTFAQVRDVDLGFALSSSTLSDLAGPLEVPVVPEPLTLALVGLSVGATGNYLRRRIGAGREAMV